MRAAASLYRFVSGCFPHVRASGMGNAFARTFKPFCGGNMQAGGYRCFLDIAIGIMFAISSTATYPASTENIEGTTSSRAAQSSLLTQFKTILYSIRSVNDTNASEQAAAQHAITFLFHTIIQAIAQNTTLIIPHTIHIRPPGGLHKLCDGLYSFRFAPKCLMTLVQQRAQALRPRPRSVKKQGNVQFR